jgi:hypothetical protein
MEQAVAFHFWIETAIHICQGPSISMVFLLDIDIYYPLIFIKIHPRWGSPVKKVLMKITQSGVRTRPGKETNLLLKMVIEIVDLSSYKMVVCHSYVTVYQVGYIPIKPIW